MKSILLVFALLMLYTQSTGQSVSINEHGTPADTSAILDVSSQTKGFLLPRMNSLQRKNIVLPKKGLLVYDNDLQSLFFYEGGQWVEFASTRKGLRDSDFNTRVVVEQSIDDDTIRFITSSFEKVTVHSDGITYNSDDDNIIIGTEASEIGSNNTIIGHDAGSNFIEMSTKNIAIGNRSLNGLSDGFSSSNTAIGYSAGENIGGGLDNVFIGTNAYNANSGSYNVSIGSESGNLNLKNGGSNVIIGAYAGESYKNYSKNVIIGSFAGKVDSGGTENITIGTEAGISTSIFPLNGNISIGYKAGQSGLMPQNNSIFIGKEAGNPMSFCTDCILLGNYSGLPGSGLNDILYIDNETTSKPLIFGNFNSNRLGFNGKVGIQTHTPSSELHVVHGNNAVEDGFKMENDNNGNYWRFYVRSSNGNLRLYSTEGESNACGNNNNSDNYVAWISSCSGAWNSTSDRRKKKSFLALENVMPSLMNLDVLKYNFISEEDTDKKHIGLIAQDVQAYFPEIVNYDEEADLYTMNYDGFGPIAIKGLQELKLENEILRSSIKKQQKEIDKLRVEFEKLAALVQINSAVKND